MADATGGVRGSSAIGGVASPRSYLGSVDGALSRLGRIGTGSAIWIYEDPTPLGQKVLKVLGSIFKVQPGAVVYIGTGLSEIEDDVQIPVPAGTALEMVVGVDEDAGAGSYVATLRKQNGDTVMVATLTGTTRKDTATGSVAFAAEDWLSVKLQLVGPAPAAHVNISLKYQFAT